MHYHAVINLFRTILKTAVLLSSIQSNILYCPKQSAPAVPPIKIPETIDSPASTNSTPHSPSPQLRRINAFTPEEIARIKTRTHCKKTVN